MKTPKNLVEAIALAFHLIDTAPSKAHEARVIREAAEMLYKASPVEIAAAHKMATKIKN